MKKKVLLLFTFLSVFILGNINVFAKSYDVGELIPVEDTALVKGENLTYSDFKLNKEERVVNFTSITNTSSQKVPISVSIGLFDADKKNVGIINYCSSNDFDTDFSGFYLKKGETGSFSLEVKYKYLKDKFAVSDISYIAILSDNSYCKVGGAKNYIGKTIQQINKQDAVYKGSRTAPFTMDDILSYFTLTSVVIFVVCLFIYIIICTLINNLHARMIGKTTALCYIPGFNNYIMAKLAFGKPIAIAYILLCLVIIPFLGNFGYIVSSIVSVVTLGLDIYKLATRNYNLCIIDHLSLPSNAIPNNRNINNFNTMSNNTTNNNTNTNNNNNATYDNVKRDNSLLNDNQDDGLLTDDINAIKNPSLTDFNNFNESNISNNDAFSDNNIKEHLVDFTDFSANNTNNNNNNSFGNGFNNLNSNSNNSNNSNLNNNNRRNNRKNNNNNNQRGNTDLENFFK